MYNIANTVSSKGLLSRLSQSLRTESNFLSQKDVADNFPKDFCEKVIENIEKRVRVCFAHNLIRGNVNKDIGYTLNIGSFVAIS